MAHIAIRQCPKCGREHISVSDVCDYCLQQRYCDHGKLKERCSICKLERENDRLRRELRGCREELEAERERREVHHLVVKSVVTQAEDKWDVWFDSDIWMTVHRHEIGREPRPGDVLKVLPPVAMGVAEKSLKEEDG